MCRGGFASRGQLLATLRLCRLMCRVALPRGSALEKRYGEPPDVPRWLCLAGQLLETMRLSRLMCRGGFASRV